MIEAMKSERKYTEKDDKRAWSGNERANIWRVNYIWKKKSSVN